MNNPDKAYGLMILESDKFEVKTESERTNVETLHEGRFIYIYDVLFCTCNNDIIKRKITVNIKTNSSKIC